MKNALLLTLLCLGISQFNYSYDPYISPSQRVGLSFGVSQQRGPDKKVFGSYMKNETYPALGVNYEYLYPETWYVGGHINWLLYELGDSSSRYPKTHFYQGEMHLGYTFYPDHNLFLAAYLGVGKTKNRIKHKDVSIGGVHVSKGAFYFIREWWYPLAGVYLEKRISDKWAIGLRGQYMPMIKNAKGSCFAELIEDQVDIVDVFCPNLTTEKNNNFSGELPITFFVPYTSSAIRVTPFGVTFFNGQPLEDGVPLYKKEYCVCVYNIGVYFEYLYIF